MTDAQHPPTRDAASVAADRGPTHREDVVQREKNAFGGIKWGSAFLGWLTATGAAVLLTAVFGAIGAGGGVGPNGDAADAAAQDPVTSGVIAAVVAAIVVLLAYFIGGYVAGRMARFDGIKQGVAVWVWAVVMAIVVAVLVAVAGSQFDVLGALGNPTIPVDTDSLTVGGIVSALVAALLALVGAVLGGLAGMRFHRRVDRAGLGR